MSATVQAKGLGRWYGQVVGLNDLDVSIGEGITGLVGPNGAGKSTFLKLIAGELRASRGSLLVLGEQPFANSALYRQLGFCPQQDALYEDLSGLAFVTLLMRLHGFSRSEGRAKAAEALDRVQLTEASQKPMATYSKGMRQRVRLAQAIAHEPKLLVADEPLNGLDPVMRHLMMDLFTELAERGMHVIVSSHVLHEVESMTSEIVLIHRGRLLAQGPVTEVRRLLGRHPHRVQLRARDTRRMAVDLMRMEEVNSVTIEAADQTGAADAQSDDAKPIHASVRIETRALDEFYGEFTKLAARENYGLESLESADESLEAVFEYLVS